MLCNAIVYLDVNSSGNDKRMLFANKKPVSQSEFYQSKQTGLNSAIKVEVRACDYHNEKYLWYKDVRYKIFRTYDKPSEFTELIAEKM